MRRPAQACHPAGDRVAQAPPVRGTASGSKPAPRSRTNTETRVGVTSVYRSAAVDPRVLGHVDQRLAGGRAERGQRVVHRGVADDDVVDDEGVVALHLGDHAGHQPGPGPALADHLRVVQPGAQLPFLAAGQPADRLLVVGVPLDERQRLQHRVVQVGGDGGALLRADARGPLRVAGVQQPAPERGGGQQQAGEQDQRGREAVAGVGQLPRRRQKNHQPGAGQHHAAGEGPAGAGDGEGAVGVQLPPDDVSPAATSTSGRMTTLLFQRVSPLSRLTATSPRTTVATHCRSPAAASPRSGGHPRARRPARPRAWSATAGRRPRSRCPSSPGARRPPAPPAGPAAGARPCPPRPRRSRARTAGAPAVGAAAPRTGWWTRHDRRTARPPPVPVITLDDEPGSVGGLP